MSALHGSGIDAGAYRWVVRAAQHTPGPVDHAVRLFSDYGIGLFAALMLLAWWRARSADGRTMAGALATPLVVVAAFLANDVVKSVFTEVRPCRALHVTGTVEACPGATDWSFPSNHAAIAAAAAVALLLADRRLGQIAVPLALLLGASRVWIGVHYPHDVLAGLAVGALAAWLLGLAARRAAPVVDRLRSGPLRPVLAAP
ncbi:phosphatase PAP2 family protein [Actinacidiphila yeochonensis]|uniref:phosphatase PAP2 family protein n=1 Tax=Actinacidiphila yeochonensis TaxID=89050 RepID=UPI000566C0C1|nr:phosphatase PAP2 family protein [Actinacidiphila yeochonensis]